MISLGFAHTSFAEEGKKGLLGSTGYFGSVQMGLAAPGVVGTGSNQDFDIGGRIGIVQSGSGAQADQKILLSIGFDHYSDQDYYGTYAFNDVSFQLSFTCPYGLYFGPTVGVVFEGITPNLRAVPLHNNSNTSYLEIGAQVGYNYAINEMFSVGPELIYDRGILIATLNTVKIVAAGTVNF